MLQLGFYGKDLFSADIIVVLTRRVIPKCMFPFLSRNQLWQKSESMIYAG